MVSQFARMKKHHKKPRAQVLRQEFIKSLAVSKKKVIKMSEKSLDGIIGGEYMKRLISYDASKWHMAELRPSELGVWKKAGDMPLLWTKGNLLDTAAYISKEIHHKAHKKSRAARVIPSMLNSNIDIFSKERYLFPIVFKHGTGTNGRRGLKKPLKGDIDDGCMRSLARTLNGEKKMVVYFGVPKNKK